MVPTDQIGKLKKNLNAVSTALVRRGFKQQQIPLLMSDGASSIRVAKVWLDSKGDPSCGWSLASGSQGRVELLLALGKAPSMLQQPLKRLGQQKLRLRGTPDDLVQLGWLGPGWPRVIRNAAQLEVQMTELPKQQQPGWLSLQLELR
jgi:hypothetical protein